MNQDSLPLGMKTLTLILENITLTLSHTKEKTLNKIKTTQMKSTPKTTTVYTKGKSHANSIEMIIAI